MTTDTVNQLPPVTEGIFSAASQDNPLPRLIGGYCPNCQRHFFPLPQYCPICLAAPQPVALESTGIIYSFTVVRTKPPFGLPRPYSIGYVDLDGTGLRVFCLLDPNSIEQLRVGLPVELAVAAIGHDARGASCLRPYFKPRNMD
ncbi:MAG: OB-fold domain-containing protein [Thermodesulfobacteriota bacterium]